MIVIGKGEILCHQKKADIKIGDPNSTDTLCFALKHITKSDTYN